MNAFEILTRHLNPKTELYECVVVHSVLVARKARQIARSYAERHPEASIDLDFLVEASLLHDIGVKECHSEKLPCHGTEPYVCHGIIGSRILQEEGLPRHALVCERHTGAGITKDEVLQLQLPLPPKDYMPLSLEEKIVCVADKFFSKTPEKLWRRDKPERIERSLGRHGVGVLGRWLELRREILGK